MNEHALDAMIYSWMVMKEKEESSMEGIFMGQIVGSCSRISEEDRKRCASIYFHDTESNACSKLSHYNKTYSLVLSDDVIKTNDEMLKLRDEVKELKIQIEMLEAANTDRAKNLLAMTKSRDYFEEKADSVEKKYEELVAEHTKLQAELAEIKTTRTLREAYITGVEKGCESLRENRDTWKRRWNSVVTDIGESLKANGITFVLKEIHGDGNWDVVIDIPELNEAKKKVEDLEKKLAASKSNETFWRDRKEEEEDYHHYWLHTFDRAVKQAADKGIHIGVCGSDEENNAGIVIVDNGKANELESQVVQMEDANQKLRQRISAADEEIEELKSQYTSKPATGWRNTYYSAVEMAKAEGVTIELQDWDLKANVAHLKVMNFRAKNLERQIKRLEDDNAAKGDHWKRNYEELTEYWDNTYKDIVAAGKEVGVKIDLKGRKPDGNIGTVYITNEKALELEYKLNTARHIDDKWQSMLDALKDKGVEVIYMGEEDKKPIIDVKIPKLDALKKELETLKSRTLDNVEIRLSCGDIVWTYCDGFVNVSSGISSIITADEIATGTIPKCSSCAHYMHNPSRFTHDWCHKPVSKEGPGTIRRLNKEEAEGPACSDFQARKE